MADATPASVTNPTPGAQTSEYKVTIIATVVSLLAAVVPSLVTGLTDIHTTFPQWAWVAPVLSGLSIVGSVLAALGYQNARTQVKVAASNAAAAVAAPPPAQAAADLGQVK